VKSLKIAAFVLIVVGTLGLAYGGFSYTKETHQAKIGPFAMSVNEKETINIPMWAAIGAIVLGGGLLFVGGRKS
jgi:TRAP-type C4-dicarboxylate transport system permease small subunit